MGIQKLFPFLAAASPEAITERKFADYSGTKQALDMSLILHQIMIAMIGANNVFKRSDGKVTAHIHGTFYKVYSMLKNGILAVPVFDGKPPDLKTGTIKTRIKTKERALLKLQDEKLTDKERIKLEKRSFSLTPEYIHDVQDLLSLMGIQFVRSLGEADSQCAALNMENVVDGVVTEDMDVLTFGTKRMLRNFSAKQKVQEVNLEIALKSLELTFPQFVELCIIFGSDYNDPIRGIGHKAAYDIYKEHGSMDGFLNHLKTINAQEIERTGESKYIIPDEFEDKWLEIKEYYMEAKVYDPGQIDIVWQEPNVEALLAYLCVENEFDYNIIKPKLNELKRMYDRYVTNNYVLCRTLRGGRRYRRVYPVNLPTTTDMRPMLEELSPLSPCSPFTMPKSLTSPMQLSLIHI